MPGNRKYLFLGLSATLYLIIGYYLDASQFILFAASFTGLFTAYLAFYLYSAQIKLWWILGGALLIRLLFVFADPFLTDDYYRYFWDGLLTVHGYNPFEENPAWYLSNGLISSIPGLHEGLYEQLNSKEYYTVYPPLSQALFAFASWISGGELMVFLGVLRVFYAGIELGIITLIHRMLKQSKAEPKLVFLYAFNPLVILEFSFHLHTEVLMIFFVLAAFYLLQKGRLALSALAMAASIGAKILPLIFIPFLVFRLGWKKGLLYGLLVLIVFLSLFLPFTGRTMPLDILQSLALYFNTFEYNASIYYLIRWIGYQITSYNVIQIVSPFLMGAVVSGILTYSFWARKNSRISVMEAALICMSIYYALSTTVHPWYITPLIAFSVLSRFSYPILWSLLISFTYINYSFSPFREVLWVVIMEYILLYSYAAWEFLQLSEGFLKWHILRRARIKVARIKHFLDPADAILDIGCGNGGVVHLLKKAGFQARTLDVKDVSRFEDVRPVIYDGLRIPFPDKSFDVVNLLTVLHHAEEPEALLEEARRLSRHKVIIIEDVYSNRFQQYLTYFTDSLVNSEFAGHPHNNKTEAAWESLFEEHRLKVLSRRSQAFLIFFRQTTYELEVCQ